MTARTEGHLLSKRLVNVNNSVVEDATLLIDVRNISDTPIWVEFFSEDINLKDRLLTAAVKVSSSATPMTQQTVPVNVYSLLDNEGLALSIEVGEDSHIIRLKMTGMPLR